MNTKISFFTTILLVVLTLSSIAQETVSINPILGSTLTSGEYERLYASNLLSFNGATPDSVVFKTILAGGPYEARAFWSNPSREEQIVYNAFQFDNISDALKRRMGDLPTQWKKIQLALEDGSGSMVSLDLVNGNTMKAEVLLLQGKQMLVDYLGNTIHIPWWEIENITMITREESKSQSPILRNPNSTRYLFAPSAIPLAKGEGYYQNVCVLINSINYGITDHVSISAGTEILSLLWSAIGGRTNLVGFANVKVGGKVADNLYLGGGVLAGGHYSSFLGNSTSVGGVLGYGIVTYGNPQTNVSISAALGNYDKTWGKNPVVVVSAMHQLTPNLGLVTENWVLRIGNIDGATSTATIMAFSGGVRLLARKLSIDLALLGTGGYYDGRVSMVPIPLPFVGLVSKF
ncbi:MAG: hypothetical protein NWR72_11210 [Bacteroidia bacterium]|nr:hypothetical protein [Bacteroidia bacterium]